MTMVTLPDGQSVPIRMAVDQCRDMLDTGMGGDAGAELITLRIVVRQMLAMLSSLDSTTTRLDGKW